MIATYLKTGWRNLVRNKVYSLINILGLSLGVTASMLCALWVADEYGVDAFHKDLDRIYIVTSTEYTNHEITYGGHDTPALLGEELPKIFPEVEYATGYAPPSWHTLAHDDELMKTEGVYAGSDFFKIFSYPIIAGSREASLPTKESIAISRRLANIFFGGPDKAIDQSIKFENYRELKVTAVFEDIGENSSERFEYALSYELFKEREGSWISDWNNSGPITFLKLHDHADAGAVKSKIRLLIKDYSKKWSEDHRLELGLQPYGEKYLYSNFKNGFVDGGRIEYVELFSIVAAFVLLIACINFMNTSTARSLKRAKEIGVRKVVGAMRSVVATQFMVEALMFTTIAVVLAVTLLMILLPGFNLVVGKHIATPIDDIKFWIGLVALIVITGTISGSYPALLLSSFKPISALRANFKVNVSSISFRRILVVVQFSLSMIFIVGTIVISKQVEYIQNKNLGYDKYNLLYVGLSGNLGRNFQTFKNEILQLPGVASVTNMQARPVELENTTVDVSWEGKLPELRAIFTQNSIGYDFVKTMNMQLAGGRDFSETHTDSSNYIINEAAAKIIGYKDPVGMPLTFWGKPGTIVGVVKDFHYNTLRVPIEPIILRLRPNRSSGYAVVRTDPGKITQVISELEALYKKVEPDFPFAHQFADEELAWSYQSEQVAYKLSRYFAVLSIFISCIGLLGLAMFTAEQRVKEMGIRKVLGATVMQIVSLLSRDFLKLISIAIVLSLPISWYIMKDWLQSFEFNVGIQWWMFALAAASTIVVALIILGLQAIKSATANPVETLRTE
ncbi:MAG: ABC transporter permease [Bacteroidota bacterium]